MDNQSIQHTRWNCTYHIVFIPKYRRKVVTRQTLTSLQRYKKQELLVGSACFTRDAFSPTPFTLVQYLIGCPTPAQKRPCSTPNTPYRKQYSPIGVIMSHHHGAFAMTQQPHHSRTSCICFISFMLSMVTAFFLTLSPKISPDLFPYRLSPVSVCLQDGHCIEV